MSSKFHNILFEAANILLALTISRVGLTYFRLVGESADFAFVIGVAVSYALISIGNKIFKNVFNTSYLFLVLIAFFQVYFLNYSTLHLTLFLGSTLLTLIFFSRVKMVSSDYLKLINALFLSIPLFFITKYFSYSLFGFGWFALIPVLAHVDDYRISKLFRNNIFWIFSLSVFYSQAVYILMGLVVMTCLVSWRFKLNNNSLSKILYFSSLVLVLNYNPLYSLGLIDSVEEGFWMGWWQRIIQGEIIYKDFWTYHPPMILNLLSGWGRLFGETVESFRGFVELLRIVGLVIINLIIFIKVKSNLIRGVGMLVVSLVCFGVVKNNIEIRSAFALFGILLGSIYLENHKKLIGLVSGITLGLALGISIETGIAAGLGMLLMICFNGFKNIKNLIVMLVGFLSGVMLWLSGLVKVGLGYFIDQVVDYALQFSRGYLGLNIDFPITVNILSVDSVLGLISRNGIWWFVVIGFFVWLGKFVFSNRKDLWLVGMYGYTLFMVRVALGRSDWQHLAFLILPVVLICLYLIWKNDVKFDKKYLVTFLLIVFLFGKQQIVELGNSMLQRWQSYGIFPGSTTVIKEDRWNGIVSSNSDVDELLEPVSYINENYKDNYLFVFPWRPELYFLVNGKNPTKSDVPIAYIDELRQKQIIEDLDKNKNVTIIYYENSRNIGGVGVNNLKLVDEYILKNFKEVGEFKNGKVMVYFEGGKDK